MMTPGLSIQIVVGEVKPQKIQFAVVGADLTDLIVHVIHIAAEITVIILVSRIISHRMVAVAIMGIIIMIPVKQGKVKSNLQALASHCLHKLCHQVTAAFGVGGFEIGVFAVKQAETVVVFCSQNHILHTGLFCGFRPFLRVVIHGIELIEILHVVFFRDLLKASHPFASGGDGIESPMDEHTETSVHKPLHSFFILFAVELIHFSVLSFARIFSITVQNTFLQVF